jgi:hypothetical protein
MHHIGNNDVNKNIRNKMPTPEMLEEIQQRLKEMAAKAVELGTNADASLQSTLEKLKAAGITELENLETAIAESKAATDKIAAFQKEIK